MEISFLELCSKVIYVPRTPVEFLLQQLIIGFTVGMVLVAWTLGLCACREAWLPQQLPDPGATLNPEPQDQKAHVAFREVHFPCWMVCKFSNLINIPLNKSENRPFIWSQRKCYIFI